MIIKTRSLQFLIFFYLIGIYFFSISATYAQKILVPPYLQPGNVSHLKKDQKVVIWQTDGIPGKFKLEWVKGSKIASAGKLKSAKITFKKLNLNNEITYLYRAKLNGLEFDECYTFRLTLNQETIAENTFDSRTKKDQTKFVVFGDVGAGTPEQTAIAYQVYLQKPQFALVTGDIAYSDGREIEYRYRFFPQYLAPIASPEKGAPLLNSIPFYSLLGNHDVSSNDFNKHPDGLAFFYFNDLPLNAPIPEFTVKPIGNQKLINSFVKNTAPRFPRMSNYSFDYGNVHIACLDANYYANPLDLSLITWLVNDMKNSKADWKMVAFHHPPFSASIKHYENQVMRVLSPILEDLGVDMVFNGHVHNYQRTLPLKFEPHKDGKGNNFSISKEGSVDGKITLDHQFDGINHTKADGIIYIVSGAGGAVLYNPELSDNPDLWKKETTENWEPFTKRLVSDRHSFTVVETDGKMLVLKQIDSNGNTFDEIKVTK